MNSNHTLLYYTLVALEIQLNVNYKFYPFKEISYINYNNNTMSLSHYYGICIYMILYLSLDYLFLCKEGDGGTFLMVSLTVVAKYASPIMKTKALW